MDANKTLARIRELVALVGRGKPNGFSGTDAEYAEQIAFELAEQFKVLDEWMSRGGFRPVAWDA